MDGYGLSCGNLPRVEWMYFSVVKPWYFGGALWSMDVQHSTEKEGRGVWTLKQEAPRDVRFEMVWKLWIFGRVPIPSMPIKKIRRNGVLAGEETGAGSRSKIWERSPAAL